MKKIIFVLPQLFPTTPIGGYKMVFSYANALVNKENEVIIYFLSDSFPPFNRFSSKQFVRFLYHKFYKYSNKKILWFKLDPRIKIVVEKTPLKSFFKRADIVFATASSTAALVDKLSARHGKHFYFIQHDESTFDPDYSTRKTWKLKMKKIAVASWIKKRVESASGDNVSLVPNFVDFKNFGIDRDIKSRGKIISMLYNLQRVKGTKYGVEALRLIKQKYPEIKVILFGTPKKPTNIPFNFEYIENANDKQLREIYNQSSIYILPSLLEGWGLTATDSMACGAALVTTENGGVDDFTQNLESAIKVPAKSSVLLADGIEKLISDDDLRIKIARNGSLSVKRFTLEKSLDKLENALSTYEEH